MIEIHGRQSSHYTRLVRLLAHELDVPYVLVPIHELLAPDPAVFAGNPALKLPALRDGDSIVWGSANACRWIARRSVGGEDAVAWAEEARTPLAMNAHELVAHAMAAEVEVVFHEIVAGRPQDAASRKRRASLESTLDWLDANLAAVRAALPDRPWRWFDLALFALLEHFPFRNPSIDLARRPALQAFTVAFGARPSARATPYVFDAMPTPPSPAAEQVAG